MRKTVSLQDGSEIYVLRQPLFNQTEKVRKAFDTFHQIAPDEPLGPPLDIPGPNDARPVIRAPAALPLQAAQPPAAPPPRKAPFSPAAEPPAIPT